MLCAMPARRVPSAPRRLRRRSLVAWLIALALFAPLPIRAEESDPPLPPLAGGDEVIEALARFEEEFKAKGLKGDDRLMQKDHALLSLATVPHPRVVARFFDLARRDRAPEVRRMALEALGRQSALAPFAGPKVVALLTDKRLAAEPDHVLACLTVLGKLRYIPPVAVLEETLKHPDYVVRKETLSLAGTLKDVRLLDSMLRALGTLDIEEKGVKWDGAEATVSTGSETDQAEAEKKAKAEAAANKARARGKGRGGTTRDMKNVLLASLAAMTGQEFGVKEDAGKWLEANPTWRPEAEAAIAARIDEQALLGKLLEKAAKEP